MRTLYRIENKEGNNPRAVFRVPTDRGNKYLCTDSTFNDTAVAVVEVETPFLLDLWRADPNSIPDELAQGHLTTWGNSHQFKVAEAVFYEGESNPPPLAHLHFGIRNVEQDIWERHYLVFRRFKGREIVSRIPFVTLTQGMAQIVGLMACNAPYFPVQCDAEEAPLLQLLAGFPDGKSHTLPELLKLQCGPRPKPYLVSKR